LSEDDVSSSSEDRSLHFTSQADTLATPAKTETEANLVSNVFCPLQADEESDRQRISEVQLQFFALLMHRHHVERDSITFDDGELSEDDVSSSSEDRSLHFTPQADTLASPAKTDATHAPSPTIKRPAPSAIWALEDDAVSTSSSSASFSDDLDDDINPSLQLWNPSMSSVKDIYVKIFQEKVQKFLQDEAAARLGVMDAWFALQQSLLSAEEYLIRHATIITSRNKFARSMLETKQKLQDMVRMHHAGGLSPQKSNGNRSPLVRRVSSSLISS
jgi:hypothetical protein